MSLTIEDVNNFQTGGGFAVARGLAPVALNKVAQLYQDSTDSENEGTVGTYSGGSISVGAQNQISDSHLDTICRCDLLGAVGSGKLIWGFTDSSNSDRPTLVVLSISDPTITPGTLKEVAAEPTFGGQLTLAASTSSLGLIAYRRTTTAARFCRFTISGTTVSVGTPVDTNGGNSIPACLCRIDDSRVGYLYQDAGNWWMQVIDISSGISQGTEQDTGEAQVTGFRMHNGLVALTSSKLAGIFTVTDAGQEHVRVVIANVSSTSIPGFGAVKNLLSMSIGQSTDAAIDRVSDSTLIVAYCNASGQVIVETLAVSGDTITQNGDSVTLTGIANANVVAVKYLGGGLAWILTNNSSTSSGYAAVVSGVPQANASFYSSLAAAALTEKFTLPFTGINPKAMTLDQTLGTVVIGSKVATTDPVIYSQYPYATGTATHSGLPTGTAYTVLRWI